MYKIVGMVLGAMLLLLAHAVHAEDNSKWCGTVTAIYGICSPELVSNWLAHKSDVYIRPPKPPTQTIVLSTPSPTIVEQVKVEAEKPKVKPCFYYTSEGWKFCRFVS